MEGPQVRYDLDHWNFDLLKPIGKPSGGNVRVLRPILPSKIRKIGFLQDDFLILLLSDNMLFGAKVRPNTTDFHRLSISSLDGVPSDGVHNERLFSNFIGDIVTSSSRVYLLAPKENRLWIIEPDLIKPDGWKARSISIPDLVARDETRLAVMTNTTTGIDTAIVLLPIVGVDFYVIKLQENSSSGLNFRTSTCDQLLGQLGTVVGLFADDEAKTVLIADTLHHRVLELDIADGSLRWVCGTGRPGAAQEAADFATSRLNEPAAISLYRPKSHIPRDHLDRIGKAIVNSDGVRPRTLQILNTGDETVRRWVEMPDNVEASTFRGYRGLFTLVGPYVKNVATGLGRSEVLLPVSTSAHSISVSQSGLVALADPKQVSILSPATAVANAQMELQGSRNKMEDT